MSLEVKMTSRNLNMVCMHSGCISASWNVANTYMSIKQISYHPCTPIPHLVWLARLYSTLLLPKLPCSEAILMSKLLFVFMQQNALKWSVVFLVTSFGTSISNQGRMMKKDGQGGGVGGTHAK